MGYSHFRTSLTVKSNKRRILTHRVWSGHLGRVYRKSGGIHVGVLTRHSWFARLLSGFESMGEPNLSGASFTWKEIVIEDCTGTMKIAVSVKTRYPDSNLHNDRAILFGTL